MLSGERGAASRAPLSARSALADARDAAWSVGVVISLPAVTCQAIWAFNVAAMKYTVNQLDPYLVGTPRALFAALLFGERLTVAQAAGAALVFGGVALTSGRRRVKI